MTRILAGAEVVEAMNAATARSVAELKDAGLEPTLAILRIGEREDEIAYEQQAGKRCRAVGIDVREVTLPEPSSYDEVAAAITSLNEDSSVHGVLMLRPLPPHLDDDKLRNLLVAAKDIDGITDASVAAVFTGQASAFSPCTPQACIEILDYYGVEIAGRRVTIVGRSLVVGKPLAMLLLQRNATVTIAHSATADLPAVVAQADIVVACVGRPQMLGAEYFRPAQTVVDVGINVLEDGSLVGDVDYAAAEGLVAAITPVPGGVGTVTTSVLVKHVAAAAAQACR
ncbi:MAG: bifunctional 5,10-methylenetetrahydrofolate dehydrogenase/5,10-methenyltetrahydrofolate cyclohydrolase [Coriobacteriales bacterium]|jgi:methylenetetrahydrofolate dehydrogenase (NADP+)/methenyltetrahydrofolate cyclohydrolase|nr:bifunctional 5,10-methylenetetrahydrofolate dehydrogenase/5,10-methenyltetrahydrofolate cyclohydrolase [Coriobacteriales bacterium]